MTDERDDDALARLLRLGGARDPAPAAAAVRVRAHVFAAWHDAVRQRARRRFLARAAVVGLAASVVMALVLRQRHPEPVVVATLERTSGPVWLTAPDEGTAAADSARGAVLLASTGVETGPLGRAALRLQGGASLRMDVGTRVRLVSGSDVLLQRGAVYVDSPSGRSRITVRTPLAVARDIGTQFELRLDGAAVRVRVREGIVNLDGAGAIRTAHQGEELRLADGGEVARGVVSLDGAEWGWTEAIAPAFDLEGQPLRALLDWYRRETHTRIDETRLPESLRPDRILLHGSGQNLSPDEVLAAVLPACGLRERTVGSAIVLEAETVASRPKAVAGSR